MGVRSIVPPIFPPLPGSSSNSGGGRVKFPVGGRLRRGSQAPAPPGTAEKRIAHGGKGGRGAALPVAAQRRPNLHRQKAAEVRLCFLQPPTKGGGEDPTSLRACLSRGRVPPRRAPLLPIPAIGPLYSIVGLLSLLLLPGDKGEGTQALNFFFLQATYRALLKAGWAPGRGCRGIRLMGYRVFFGGGIIVHQCVIASFVQ